MLLVVLITLPAASATAQDAPRVRVKGSAPLESAGPSYEYLIQKGKLLFEHGRFRESVDAFIEACETARGLREAGCWQRLATVAERAGMIGVAMDAWQRTAELDARLADQALAEEQRLRQAFGKVTLELPPDTRLPSRPIEVRYEGLLIDPQVKKYLKRFLDLAAVAGLEERVLWLPAGRYSVGDLSFESVAGESRTVSLGSDLVPYRPAAFGLRGAAPSRSVPGPWALSVAFEMGLGNAPGDGIGVAPAGLGLRVGLTRRLGPVRFGGGLRLGATITSASGEDEEGLRDGSAWHALGEAEVGVDLAVRPALYLTPRLAFVGGSLGQLLFSCLAEEKASGIVYRGECRLGGVALGGRAGVDLWYVPERDDGRVVLRVGLWAEALGGRVLAAAGDVLAGGLEASLVRVDSNRFVWLRGGFDVGPVIRF
tara:strand:+ start:76 stop:1356 length:1281 start_codon:yes stop_codon:yes gene_type:complete